MKRSEINWLVLEATRCFEGHGWALPPNPRWDVTDFGLGAWSNHGLVLVNLAEEPEYCEKLMYARAGMVTPFHFHRKKKEDIICRWGELRVRFLEGNGRGFKINCVESGFVSEVLLRAGERVTIPPGLMHAFEPSSSEAIVGEVSTSNDDLCDNFFLDERVGRFSQIEEDEAPHVRLVSDVG